ncbi:hypothetical protein GCM10010191_26090 [Actinomadura vinacea]|uniref:Histidine kinase/HSP90-like ATPase domain-containing protein n=1 Tax=Actinomadura vinacea TaxID=115336 RepID=A0ABN3IV70_9ACTN
MEPRILDIPGLPSMVPFARSWVRAFLDMSPLAHAAELVMDELVTNAMRHSASGEDGGSVRVELADQGEVVRIAVSDDGPRSAPAADWTADEAASFGRGLTIVDALSSSWGEDKDADGRCTWAEVTQPL